MLDNRNVARVARSPAVRLQWVALFLFMNRFARRILQFPVAIVMAIYYTLTAITGPIVRPIARALAKLHILSALRSAIERLGPYPSLVSLAVPVIIIEPLKIGALAILASGRLLLGTLALVISHGLSLIIIEHLFDVVKPKLLQLHWFAVSWEWFISLRDPLLAWLHSTWAWSIMLRIKNWLRAAIARVLLFKAKRIGHK